MMNLPQTLTTTGEKFYRWLRPTKTEPTDQAWMAATLYQHDIDSDKALAAHNYHLKLSLLGMALLPLNALPPMFAVNMALGAYNTAPMGAVAFRKLIKERRMSHDLALTVFTGLCATTGLYYSQSLGIVFYHLSKRTLAKAQEDTKGQLVQLLHKQELQVWCLRDGVEVSVPLQSLQVGDVVLVETGEVIPVDGVVVEGQALVDQRALTGESTPIEKGVGGQVMASTVIVSGRLQIQVEQPGDETMVAKIEQVLHQTISNHAAHQMKGEKWADWSSIPIGIAAIVSWPFMGLFGPTQMLNLGFGNRLRLFGSLSTLSYLSAASKADLLIKDGRVFELIGDIDTILFDKTGTLTQSQPRIGEISPYAGRERSEVLRYAALAEQKLAHPIAQAIIQEAEQAGIAIPHVDDAHYELGYGITVQYNGEVVRVGGLRFFDELVEWSLPDEMRAKAEAAHEQGISLVIVAVDDEPVGTIALESVLRPEAVELIAALRKQGVEQIALVSGDHPRPTQKIAAQLGVDQYFAHILPEQKGEIVAQLQAEGRKVCFVGDGINDAIAIKKADVSISLRGATTVATDLAQVILLDGNLLKIEALFDLSHKLNNHISQALSLTLVPFAFGLFGTFFINFGVLQALIINDGLGLGGGLLHSLLPQRHQLGTGATISVDEDE